MRFTETCRRGLARRRDNGDVDQIWRAAANIINKQSQKADKGWSSWGLNDALKLVNVDILGTGTESLSFGQILYQRSKQPTLLGTWQVVGRGRYI